MLQAAVLPWSPQQESSERWAGRQGLPRERKRGVEEMADQQVHGKEALSLSDDLSKGHTGCCPPFLTL